MSQSTIAASSEVRSKSSTQSRGDVRSLEGFTKFDDRIAELSDKILPKQPYLVTIPSELPYRKHQNDPNRWYLHTPFSKREEQLQYMSLLLHQDDDEALLRVDGTRIDDEGRLQAPVLSPRSDLPSRPETPVENVSKKKISLKDYRTKDNSTLNTPERKPTDDVRKRAIKSRKEEADAERDDHRTDLESSKNEHALDTAARGHSFEKKDMGHLPRSTSTIQDLESHRPAKKRRLSADQDSHAPKSAGGVMRNEDISVKRTIPSLLSPDMPDADQHSEKSSKLKSLPQLLRPNLPPGLEKILSTAPHRSEDVKAILKAGLSSPVHIAEKKGTEATKAPSPGRIRSDSQLSSKSTVPGVQSSSPHPRPLSAAGPRTTAPLQNGRTASPRPRQSHVIVLRYGKKNRKRVDMLLKFAPRPPKSAASVKGKESTTGLTTSTKPEAPVKVEKSHITEAIPDSPIKKTKVPTPRVDVHEKLERPATPKPEVAIKSPRLRSTFSTPRKEALKEHRSIAMQRVVSSDAAEVRTPSHDTVRYSTPLAVSQTSHPKTSPIPHSTHSRSEEIAAWTEVQTSIFQLGRTLKKDGSRLATEGHGKERECGVITLVEALLCFMVNAGAVAQVRPNVDPGWSSILPYLAMVWKQSRPYKHLHGLVSLLGAIVRQNLQHEHMRRLSKETLPFDDHNNIGSAPTPGSDGNTRNSEDPTETRKSFLKFRDEMVQNSKELRIAWLEGLRLLNPDIVEEQYPKTWAMRHKDMSRRNPDKLKAKECGKSLGYYVPMDVTTNVFEATNFALAFLFEWTMIEGVPWKSKIDSMGLLN